MAAIESLIPSARATETAWRRAAWAMFTVGWGANHFVPLLPVYRRTLGLGDAPLAAIFGSYLFGLAPGLLLGGPASDRYGRRPLVLAATVVSLLASLTLIGGTRSVLGLYAGRLLIGLAAGTMFAVGTAWVKELSNGHVEGSGARRAAITLSAGFGTGPLIAGVLAQWGPAPAVLPYLMHIALGSTALALLRGVPETVVPAAAGSGRAGRRVLPPLVPRFRRLVLPMAPWVFGSATISFVVLPAQVGAQVAGLSVAFDGLAAAVTLASGIAVQPLARRLDDRAAGRASAAGLSAIATGCAGGALAAALHNPVAVLVVAVVLGSGYGLCLVSGLREAERLAAPHDLAGTIAVYYVLCYAGFAVPYLLALIAPALGYPASLLAAAALAVATLVRVTGAARVG